MSYVDTALLKNSTIMMLYTDRDEIDSSPAYQREGGIWPLEKRRLLIDSILNDYDIPKIYFHVLKSSGKISQKKYAVIDGRQRLEAIWDFIDGRFSLSSEFEYQRDRSVKLASLSYNEIAEQYPRQKVRFDAYLLPVVAVTIYGDENYIIEDMFSRLNEAVALNAAEKRNAIGGDLVRAITKISKHKFFASKVKFRNNRYQHRESASRFLLLEDGLSPIQGTAHIVDTKKVFLDSLAKKYKEKHKSRVNKLEGDVTLVLEEMARKFGDQDEILSAQGTLVVYYLLFKAAMLQNKLKIVTRRKLLDFRKKLVENREIAAKDITQANYDFLEFDRLNQQGTNDASSIKERARILGAFLGVEVIDTLDIGKPRFPSLFN